VTFPFTEADIDELASASSVERGYGYFHSGAVSEIVRRGDLITAEVAGSSYRPYEVQITLDENGIFDADCSCPYDWGGYCKHIVAVLLACLEQAEAIAELPSLASLLAGLSADQLRGILLGIAADQPALISAIEREIGFLSPKEPAANKEPALPAADLSAIRREIAKDFQSIGRPNFRRYDYYYDDYDGGDYLDPDVILKPHLDRAQALLADGQIDAALDLIMTAVECWADGLQDLEEWVIESNEDAMLEGSEMLAAALAETLLSLELLDDDREEWLATIEELEEDLGGFEIAATAVAEGWADETLTAVLDGRVDILELPTEEAQELISIRLRILERQGRRKAYIRLAQAAGEMDLCANMLAREGQVERALAMARTHLTHPDQILQLAQLLTETGQTSAALEIADFGLNLPDKQESVYGFPLTVNKEPLAVWLRKQAELGGNGLLALRAAQAAFQANVTLANYQEVERLAGDGWQEIKPNLLAALSSGRGQAVSIYLHEEMLVEAMRAVDKQAFYYSGDLERTIAATRQQYPDWGIAKYQRLAEAIMDAGKAKDYDTAAGYLSRAYDIYKQHDRLPEWQTYLNGLLEKHGRKYKLVPMLREIGRA